MQRKGWHELSLPGQPRLSATCCQLAAGGVLEGAREGGDVAGRENKAALGGGAVEDAGRAGLGGGHRVGMERSADGVGEVVRAESSF